MMLTNFLQTPQDKMLSVLCGYFNKILVFILTKENSKFLEYLLLRRDGRIFDGLMAHIEHHSLAQLVIELLQVQIKPEDSRSKKITMYNSDGSDNEQDNEEQDEAVLTADQIKMKEILAKKGDQVILYLLDQMSVKNTDDIEVALNAHSILMDFCENDHCFNLLTTEEAMKRLIQIVCQGMQNNQVKYAMQLLLTIITEFSNTEKEITDERKGQIHKLFAQYFPDIAYNCVIVLMQQHPGEETYVNQTQLVVQKVGYTRFRAIELLKILFVTVQKMGALGKEIVSSLLRAKVIDSMLHMIRTYTFCSLSHAQCIQILNAMKENFEAEDVQKLKEFVFVELEGQAKFEFPSGRTCSGPNMGQIT